MISFNYKAMNADGKIIRGQMEAYHILDLETRLSRDGLDLITGKEKSRGSFLTFKRVDRRELINFCVYINQLIVSGVPLLEALKDLRDSLKKDYFQEVVSGLVEKIEGGERFSAALEHYPRVFSVSFVNMIAAGEESGKLATVLDDLVESMKWQDELAAQAKKALTYPAITLLVIVAAIFFLMIYLVPQLIAFIESMEGTLPPHTQALIATSDFFVEYWLHMIGLLILTVVVVTLARRRSLAFSIWYDKVSLRLPIYGGVAKKITLARFAHYLSMLYASGITILRAIEICEKVVSNKFVEAELEHIKLGIINGQKIHEAVAENGLFPSLTVRMIRVGEHTGELESALGNVAYFYKREVDEVIERIKTLIEPVLTAVMGAVIAWIMLSVLGPLYNLMTVLDI